MLLFEVLYVLIKKKRESFVFKKICFNDIKFNLRKEILNFKLLIKCINMMSKLIGININYRYIFIFCLFYFFIFILFRY